MTETEQTRGSRSVSIQMILSLAFVLFPLLAQGAQPEPVAQCVDGSTVMSYRQHTTGCDIGFRRDGHTGSWRSGTTILPWLL